MRMKRSALAITAAVGLAVAGGTAFTASNTVADTSAGQGESVTTGFTADNVEYTLDAISTPTTGDKIVSVSFDLVADDADALPAGQARVRILSTNSYSECDTPVVAGAVASFDCTLSVSVAASAADTLDIVAVSSPV